MADLPDVNQRFVADMGGYVRDVDHGANRVDHFGDRNTAAALAARRMGVTAKESAEKAARAQRQAADAAEKLARGEISVEKAAEAAARSERALERADIAQAAAARSAAKATEDLADEQRQAARAAELAAAKMRLASLKASGSVKEHDSLIRQLRLRFGDLGKEGGKAFTEIGSSASKTSAMLAKSSPLMLAGIVIGLGSLPVLASIAASAVTLGLGGALIGLGVVGAAQSKKVQKAFTDLGKHVKTEAVSWGKPFEKSLLQTSKFFTSTFDSLAPTMKASLGSLAPVFTEFTDDLARSLTEFKPAIRDVAEAAGPLLREFGQQLPGLMRRTADAISQIAKAADPVMFGRFIDGLGMAVAAAGDAIFVLSKLANVVSLVGPISAAASRIDDLGRALHNLTSGADAGSLALEAYQRAVTSFHLGSGMATAGLGILSSSTATATARLASMKTTMQLAAQSAVQLKTDLDALSGKTLTLRQATSAYEAAIDAASASLKENGRSHGFATEKGRANEAALDAIAVAAQNEAVEMRKSDKSAADVARRMEEARRAFISTAMGMGKTRAEATALATKLFGVRDAANSIPKSKSTKVTTPGVGNAIRASKDMSAAVRNIPQSWPVTISYYVRNQGAAIAASKRMYKAKGGYVDGYADGGMVQGYPAGGFVTGPGTTTSDSILAALSNKEFVVNAQSTSEFRPLLEAINAGRVTPKSAAYEPAMTSRPMMTPRGGDGAQQIVNVNVYVQGSVVSERKLIESVRVGLAGISVLNPGRNGATVSRTV